MLPAIMEIQRYGEFKNRPLGVDYSAVGVPAFGVGNAFDDPCFIIDRAQLERAVGSVHVRNVSQNDTREQLPKMIRLL